MTAIDTGPTGGGGLGSGALLYTPEQVAERLQIPVGTLRRWVTEGTVPSHRIGRRTRFTQDDLSAIIEQTAAPAAAPMRNGVTSRRRQVAR